MKSASDIIRHHPPVEPDKCLNLYLGSGRMGAAFNAAGLMDATPAPGHRRVSHTALMHADHWHDGRFELQHHLPLLRLSWAEDPLAGATSYRQTLHLRAGRLVTSASTPSCHWTLTVAASPREQDRDVLAFELSWDSGRPPDWEFHPIQRWTTSHGEAVNGHLNIIESGRSGAALQARTGNALSWVCVAAEGRASLRRRENRLSVQFLGRSGRASILLATGAFNRRGGLEYALSRLRDGVWMKSFASAWQRRHGTTGVDLPVPWLQALHDRCAFFALSSFAPEIRCPAPPMGWSGNNWGHHFPQDLSFVAPAMLRLGHSDIVRSWVDFYATREAQMRAMTERVYRAHGAMWAWEFPISPHADPLTSGSPSQFQYEIHNAAYPARMAWETARAVRDKNWVRASAWPVIRASADFYTSVLKRGRDGKWGIHVTPSSGQDEYGGVDHRNFLCALFSADFSLRTALDCAALLGLEPPAAPQWRKILADGLAYPRLLEPRHGFYRVSEDTTFQPRLQKHPVQLNPLTILPLGAPTPPTLAAYAARRNIVASERETHRHKGVPGDFYDGWTLPALTLASSRMGDSAAFAHELSMLQTAQLVDPEWIQIYESSGHWCPYYTTSAGLLLSAIHDSLGHDFFAPAPPPSPAWPPWWGRASATLCGNGKTRR